MVSWFLFARRHFLVESSLIQYVILALVSNSLESPQFPREFFPGIALKAAFPLFAILLLWIDFSPYKFTLLEKLPVQSLEVLHLWPALPGLRVQ